MDGIFNDSTTVLSPFDIINISLASIDTGNIDTDHIASRRDLRLNDPCSNFRFWLNAVVVAVLCLIGLTGNTAAIFALRGDRHHHPVAAFLLQSLAVADNLVLVVSFVVLTVFFGWLPLADDAATVTKALPYVIKYVNPFGPIVQSCSIWITVVLAVNRYVAVCKPFSAVKRLTMNSARIQVLTVVVLSVLLNLPRFFQYDILVKTANQTNNVIFNRSAFGRNVHFEVIYFNVFYTSVVLVLPLVVLVILNLSLVKQLRASRKRMQRNSLGNYSGQSESDITVIMVAIILLLVVCHTPDRIVEIVRFIAYRNPNDASCPAPIFYANQLANILIIFSSATDFIVYYVFRRRFRIILRDRFLQIISRCLPTFVSRCKRKRDLSTVSELLSDSSAPAGPAVFDLSGRQEVELKDNVNLVNQLNIIDDQTFAPNDVSFNDTKEFKKNRTLHS